MTKKLLIVLYLLVIIVLAAATIVEKFSGPQSAAPHIYGSWWFIFLWAMLTVVAVVWMFRQRAGKRFNFYVLHASFVVILAGALLTHLTSRQGIISLRQGVKTDKYLSTDNPLAMAEETLPFSIELTKFQVTFHDGTTAVSDYISHIIIHDGKKQQEATISMNKIFSYRGYRLYQSSYDDDMQGTCLTLNADPWGIPVTYIGYGLLFFALIYMLFDPHGAYRRVLRSPYLKRLVVALACALPFQAHAAPTLPKDVADQFGRLHMVYNNRVCPVQTFAIDFTKKLHGKRHYGEYSAEQVLAGFIFWPDQWNDEPIIRIKSGPLKSQLQLADHVSVNFFFNSTLGGYILGPHLRDYYRGQSDKFHQQVADMDDRLKLVMDIRRGTPLCVFPYTVDGSTTWYSPVDQYSDLVNTENQKYMRNLFAMLNAEAQAGHFDNVADGLSKLKAYQQRYGASSLPTPLKAWAEQTYNNIPFATILFMFNLTLGFTLLFYEIFRRTKNHFVKPCTESLLFLSFLALTFCLALRWIISGTIPMANGYETMLITAWSVMVVALLAARLSPIIVAFGFLVSGFFLLVSHISQMDPQITHVQPVLNSPLLTIHVSVIMMAYALLSLTFVCAAVGLLVRKSEEQLAVFSRLFLFPALSFLGIGIFVGAIWANISWGQYWSWDPKETWALITFMVYAVVVHTSTLPVFRRPRAYHAYLLLAFLTLLMTYFGVNYFLGGMHSYA